MTTKFNKILFHDNNILINQILHVQMSSDT